MFFTIFAALIFAVIAALLLAACQPVTVRTESTVNFNIGDMLVDETFTSGDNWEQWYNESGGVELRVLDEAFRISAGDVGYVWALHDAFYEDVVIDAQTRQLSEHLNNGYGIICRARENGEGYYFLISGDGYFSIRRSEGQEVNPLVEWQESDVIQRGESANNLRAVCIDNYLALYVNGVFVAETWDNAYFQGRIGVAGASRGGSIVVTFDNLTVREGSINGE
jgi:hypothetical protein